MSICPTAQVKPLQTIIQVGFYSNSIEGSYANADWGVYNAISNGANQAGLWRTLTKDEWIYLFKTRTDATNKWGLSTVNSVAGVVILPDAWTLPSGCSFTAGKGSGFATNTYTSTQWKAMESNGAVLLPVGGYRSGTEMGHVGECGYYWSTTYSSASYSYYLYFSSTYLNPSNQSSGRYYGHSVRLVIAGDEYEELFVDLKGAQADALLNVYVKDGKIIIEHATGEVRVYDVMGRLVKSGLLSEVAVPVNGLYIVKNGSEVKKVVVK